MTTGLILVAHGARDARWADPFARVADRVRSARPDANVRLAFLEFMTPDLPSAAVELVTGGCVRIEVVPLFLGGSGHVRRDLPDLLDALRQRYAGVPFTLHGAVGEDDLLIDAMAAIAGRTLER
jgi:sirohydrochlorin cobaltochelatase